MSADKIAARDFADIGALVSHNVLNDPAGTGNMWTRVNVGEAIPGTITPLNADFQRKGNSVSSSTLFYRLGLQKSPQAIRVGDADLNAFFCGKAAINVDFLRAQMDRMPGTSGDQFEQSILGSVRDGVSSEIDKSRYPIAIVKILNLIKALPGENKALGEATDTWWRQSVERVGGLGLGDAFAMFLDARNRYADIVAHAGLVAVFSPAILNQVASPLKKMGEESELLTVASGYGNVKETVMLEMLWNVSKGRVPNDEFIRRYGYMCANAGELAAVSWREDPSALDLIIRTNSAAEEDKRPDNRLKAVVVKARAKQKELLTRADFSTRQRLKIGFWMARRLLPIREVGKACMFQATDVARASARRCGEHLVAAGVIEARDDIFYLSLKDLEEAALAGKVSGLKAAIEANKKLHRIYSEIDLPDFFSSEDLDEIIRKRLSELTNQDAKSEEGHDATHIVKGVAASAGTVTGRAKVIADPSSTEGFEPGDILICKVTDPGWSALFSIAGALVADIGGMLSHSAIIARELGIPAVVGTRKGTKLIADGAMITVDGLNGTVAIHS